MKKILFILSCLFSVFFITTCSDPNSPEDSSNRFSIYLLADDTLNVMDIQDKPISSLKLENTPIISYNDIESCNFDEQIFYLNRSLKQCLGKDTLAFYFGSFGKPFVVVALKQRIYTGSLHSLVSSWLPQTPTIMSFGINTETKYFQIYPAPCFEGEPCIDVRNDSRIYRALKSKIIN